MSEYIYKSKLYVGDSCVMSIQSLKIQNKKRNKTTLVESNMKMKKWKPSSKHYIFQLPEVFRTQIVNLNSTIDVQTIPYNSCEKQMGDWYTQKYD